jgi:H+-translocating NAD(P) transhydrogenase subunit alpha
MFTRKILMFGLATALLPTLAIADTGAGFGAIDGFLALYIFMLAAFTGHEIIGKVPVILHTPLMSGSNFVHGIVLVGAMIALGHADTMLGKVLGFIAVLLGAGNAAGGYVVTERMLEMFKPSEKKGAKS